MQWNLMDVGITDVLDVIPMIDTLGHGKDYATAICGNVINLKERTNAINLKEEFSKETKGGYVDFCSLYPHVLKYEDYPVGHPIHINGNFNSPITSFACTEKPCPVLGTEDCNGMHLKLKYFGLIKAKILPPHGLLLPILPIKKTIS